MTHIDLQNILQNKKFIQFYIVPKGSLSNVTYYYNQFRRALFLRANASDIVSLYIIVG